MHSSYYENPEDVVISALWSLVERSLLEYSARSRIERFHYHRLIREFFLIQNKYERKSESFLSGFHQFYSNELYAAAITFHMNHKPSLAFLDTERHNIQLLLDNLAAQKIIQRDEFVAVITAIAIALDSDFLDCRFTREDLLKPLKSGLIHLDHHIKAYMTQLESGLTKFDCHYEPKISFTSHRLVCTYETLIHNVAEIENQLHGSEFALRVYGDRKDIMESIKQPWNTRPYLDFLNRLAHYYQIEGFKDEEIECYRRINDHSWRFTEIICKEEKCRYVDVANMHASLGNDREAASFYELSLSKETHEVMQKVEIFYELCKIYERLHLYDKAEEVFEKLLSMHSEIMTSPAAQIFRYSDVVWNIVHLYNQYQKYPKAAMLEEKLLESLSDIGTIPDEKTLMAGVAIVRKFFHSRDYEKSIQLGQNILQALARDNNDVKGVGIESDVAKQEIIILIGRAKFHSGDFSAGLDELETALVTFASGTRANLICKYLIFRPLQYFSSCSTVKIRPYTIFKFGQTLWYLLFVPPLALSNEAMYYLSDKPRQPLVTSTDVVNVESKLEIWDYFAQIQFCTYIKQLIYGYAFGIVELCVKSVLLRLVINIASVLFRLWILYMLCKFMLMLSRFANQYRCVCFFITAFASLFLLCLAVFVLLFYLLYLRRILN